MRERDLNHKDKQNFDAVLHVTDKSVITLLNRIPDSKATSAFLLLIRCVIDSFLDKKLDILCRVEKAWYAVFFLRYWRQWLILNSRYTLGSNFITLNAYMCVEINAHSLITFIMTLRELDNECFLPWLLGSQSCEKIFRTVCSMSSTFSTIINFGMLALLRRLHRIHIQFCLESEAENTGIKYPHVDRHKSKDGHNQSISTCVCSVEDRKILEAVERGKKAAQKAIRALGMADILEKKNFWENPPIPTFDKDVEDDEDENDDEVESETLGGEKVISQYLQEVNEQEDADSIASEISKLSTAGLIETSLSNKLTSLHTSVFKRVPGSPLPLYAETSTDTGKPAHRRKYHPYLPIKHKEKDMYIHKTTAVWLLQEGERVSADRLFRVRSKQPYTCEPQPLTHVHVNTLSAAYPTIEVGNICAFAESTKWKLGRVLKFAYYMEKKVTSRQYTAASVNINSTSNLEKIGVLCSWYSTSASNPARFSISCDEEPHAFHPITSYLCTLSHGTIEKFEREGNQINEEGILQPNLEAIDLATAQHLTLKATSLSHIDSLLENMRVTQLKKKTIIIEDGVSHDKNDSSDYWVRYGGITLSKKDRYELTSGKELSDLHVNAYQALLKSNFPQIHGFQNTLLQQKYPLEHSEVLQVIHVRKSHWATIETSGSNVYLYDSSYTSLSTDTYYTIAQLVRCKESEIKIHVMNISKQTGSTDCALFALAIINLLALGGKPSCVVFNQQELRPHLLNSFECGTVSAFPVLKQRRPASMICKMEICPVYCYCRLPDSGEVMTCCDGCDEWFHNQCINSSTVELTTQDAWYCHNCEKADWK